MHLMPFQNAEFTTLKVLKTQNWNVKIHASTTIALISVELEVGTENYAHKLQLHSLCLR